MRLNGLGITMGGFMIDLTIEKSKVGQQVNEFTPSDNIGFISATKIRESIKTSDDSWRDMVDKSIQTDVETYLIGDER